MSATFREISLVLLLSLPIARAAHGQWPAEIAVGARVQARLPEVQRQAGGRRGHLLRGRITGLTADSLYLAVTDSVGPVAIPRRLIERLEYSRGVPSRASSALTYGARTALATALVTVLWNELDSGSDRTSTGTAALVGGGVGFVAGAAAGALYPQERWRRVQLGVALPLPR